ncbi:uncharacterized protein LOC143257079 [Tachypleus tridentatus]|uniref:uncharacterized protein LOC143257079 n=1 Tax=Tachypleus tridentatus TaxID=6853 RepID=UPI003FD2303C
MMKELSKLNQTKKDRLLVLFRTVLYMALNAKPFSNFQELLLLQEHTFDINLTEHYANDKQAVIFMKYTVETIRINVRSRLHASLFFGIMTDSSTDTANIEQEIVYVRYLDSDCYPVTHFLCLQSVEKADSEHLRQALSSALSINDSLNDLMTITLAKNKTCDLASTELLCKSV